MKTVREIVVFRFGCSANDRIELITLRYFSIQPIPRKPVSFISVSWQPPPPCWIKVNTDRSALGLPILLGGGSRGLVHGCFLCLFILVWLLMLS